MVVNMRLQLILRYCQTLQTYENNEVFEQRNKQMKLLNYILLKLTEMDEIGSAIRTDLLIFCYELSRLA